MKKQVLLLLLVALSCFHGIAQKPAALGEVTMEEMTMANYPKDPSASAVILFDRGSCTLNDKAEVVYKRHIRIKFFTNDAIEEFATKKIILTRDNEFISKIRGISHNLENGKIVQSKLTDEGIFKTKQAKIYDEYSFTLPNARPGSVIEYSYIINYDLALLPSWNFQNSIPTILSEYEMIRPSTFAV